MNNDSMMQMMDHSSNSMMMNMPVGTALCWTMHILLLILGVLASIVLILLIIYLWRLIKKSL